MQRRSVQTIVMLKNSTLKDALYGILLNGDAAFNCHGIPKSTLKYHYVKFESFDNLLGIKFGDVTR